MSVEQDIAELRARVVALEEAAKPVDISGEYGDKEVRKDPQRWQGPSMVGKRWSQCPADYLEMLAGLCDWKANKNDEEFASTGNADKKKYARYEREDAKRIRAHAQRAGKSVQTNDAQRYGATGHGASAKHAVDRDDDDTSLPF